MGCRDEDALSKRAGLRMIWSVPKGYFLETASAMVMSSKEALKRASGWETLNSPYMERFRTGNLTQDTIKRLCFSVNTKYIGIVAFDSSVGRVLLILLPFLC